MAAGSGGASIKLPIELEIQNMQQIANSLRQFAKTNVLSDSLGGKKIDSELSNILRKLSQIEVRAKGAFKTDASFNSVDNQLRGVETSLEHVRDLFSQLTFSDLQLPPELQSQFAEIGRQIMDIQDKINAVKPAAMAKLKVDSTFQQQLGAIFGSKEAGKLLESTFDQLQSKVQTEAAKLAHAFEIESVNLKDAKAKMDAAIAGQDDKKMLAAMEALRAGFQKPSTAPTWMQQAFTMKDGQFANFTKGITGANVLYKALKEQFSLSDQQIAEIRKRLQSQVGTLGQTASEVLQKTVLGDGKAFLGKDKGAAQAAVQQFEEAAKAYEKQLQAVEKAKRSSEQAQGALGTINTAAGGNSAAVKALNSDYAALTQRLVALQQAAVNAVKGNPAVTQGFNDLGNAAKKVGAAVEEGRQKLAATDSSYKKMDGLTAFIGRYFSAYAIIHKVTSAIKNAINEIKEIDKVITNIAVVTNMSQEQLWNKIGEYTNIAQQYGVATKDVYSVSQIFYQQGLQTAQVMSLTTETLKMAKIAGMEYSAAANAMTVAVRAFKIEMTEAQQVTDTYSALAAKFAVSSAEIANAMEKTASSAASVGMSLQSTSAFMSVMIQTTRESAQNIGSAMKSIISRYGEMKASPDKLINVDGEEAAFNKVDTALASVGISIKDASGQFRDFDDVIMELAQKWGTLDNNTQRYIATIMAGNRQQSRFLALVSNYDELNRAMTVANNAENASIVQVAKTMDSIETKTQQLHNAWSQLYLDLGLEDAFKGVLDIVTNIVTTIGQLGLKGGLLPTLMNVVGGGRALSKLPQNLKEIGLPDKVKNKVAEVRANHHNEEAYITDNEGKRTRFRSVAKEYNKAVDAKDETAIKNLMEKYPELEKRLNPDKQQETEQDDDSQIISSIVDTSSQITSAIGDTTTAVNNVRGSTEQVAAAVSEGAGEIVGAIRGEDTSGAAPDKTEASKEAEPEKPSTEKPNEEPKPGEDGSTPPVDKGERPSQPPQSERSKKSGMKASTLGQIEELAGKGAKTNNTEKRQKYTNDILGMLGLSEEQRQGALRNTKQLNNLQQGINNGALRDYVKKQKELATKSVTGADLEQQLAPIIQRLEELAQATGLPIEALKKLGDAAAGVSDQLEEASTDVPPQDTSTVESPKDEPSGGSPSNNTPKKLDENVRRTATDWLDDVLSGKVGKFAAAIAPIAATAATAVGASMKTKSDDSVETNKILTGVGNGLSMGAQGAQLGSIFGPWGTIIGAVGGFILGSFEALKDGLEITDKERYDMAKQEAEEAKNTKLKKEAEVIDLSSQIDNLKALKNAMYDSDESMQAYKEAMNNMADQYPSLISAYDAAGNAIINLDAAESQLTQTRLAAANATTESLKKEYRTAQLRAKLFKDIEAPTADSSGQLNINSYDLLKGAVQTVLRSNADDFIKQQQLSTLLDDNTIIVQYGGKSFATQYSGPTGSGVTITADSEDEDLDWLAAFSAVKDDESNYVDVVERISEAGLPEIVGDPAAVNGLLTFWANIDTYKQVLDFDTAQSYLGQSEDYTITLADAQIIHEAYLAQKELNDQILNSMPESIMASEAQGDLLKFAQDKKENKLSSIIGDNDFFGTLITNIADQMVPGSINELYKDSATASEASLKIGSAAEQLWNYLITLSDNELENFVDVLSHAERYSTTKDMMDALNIDLEALDPQIAEALGGHFNSVIGGARSRVIDILGEGDATDVNKDFKILEKLIDKDVTQYDEHLIPIQSSDLTDLRDNIKKIPGTYANFFADQLNDIRKLAESGYQELATGRLTALESLAKIVSGLENDTQKNDVMAIVKKIDFSDYDQLTQGIEDLTTYAGEKGIDLSSLIETLKTARDNIVLNVHTFATQLVESITTASSEISSLIGANKTGLDLSAALKAFTSLQNASTDVLNFDEYFEYDSALGKYVYTEKGLLESIKQQEASILDRQQKLEKAKEEYSGVANNKFLGEVDNIVANGEQSSLKGNEQQRSAWVEKQIGQFKNLETADQQTRNIYENLLQRYVKEGTGTFEEFIKYLIEQNDAEALAAQQVYDNLLANKKNLYYQQIDWKALAAGTDKSGISSFNMDQMMRELGYIVKEDKYVQAIKDENGELVAVENGITIDRNYTNALNTYYAKRIEDAKDDEEKIAALNAEKEALIRTLDGAYYQRKQTAITNAIQNWSKLGVEQYNELIELFGSNIVSQFVAWDAEKGIGTVNVKNMKDSLSEDTEAVTIFTEALESFNESVLSSINSSIDLVVKGTTSLSSMQSFIDNAEAMGITIDRKEAFSWDEASQSWTLNILKAKEVIMKQAAWLIEQGLLNDEDVTSYVNSTLIKTLRDNIKISDYLKGNRTDQDKNTLVKSVADYIQMTGTDENGDELTREAAEEAAKIVVASFEQGGETALNELLTFNSNASVEEQTAVYKSVVNKLQSVASQVNNLMIGSFVGTTGVLYEYLHKLGMVDTNGVVQASFNLVGVYSQIYYEMTRSLTATVQDLNNAYLNIINAAQADSTAAFNALEKGPTQSLADLTNIFTSAGKLLSDYVDEFGFVRSKAQDWLKSLGHGQVEITDFDAMAQEMGWEIGSAEYTSAYNKFNEGLISLNRTAEKAIQTELTNVISAKNGDQINLTYLWKTVGDGLNDFLTEVGAEFNKGILTIDEDTNLAALQAGLKTFIEKNKDALGLLESDVYALFDSLDKIFTDVANAIKKGIEGTMSYGDKGTIEAALGIKIDDSAFTKTAQGLKLSTAEAIKLYNQLKAIDQVAASIVFDALNSSLRDADEHYASLTSTLQRIAELQELINNADEKTSNARLEQYKQELAVAKEIAEVRVAQEDDSFNFMSKDIPGGQKNVLNYAKNWNTAFSRINDAFDVDKVSKTVNGVKTTGFIDYQDWYNIVTEMNRIAKLGGPIEFAGITLDGSLQAAANAIEQGANALTTVDTGELKVALGSIGLGIQSGSELMNKGVTDGIHAAIQASIDMLDGWIQILEVIVAMEQMGDIDLEGNGIDFEDLFYFNTEERRREFDKYSKGYDDFRNYILQRIDEKNPEKYNEQLAKALKNLTFFGSDNSTRTLGDLLSLSPTELHDLEKTFGDSYSQVLDAFYQAFQSGEFDVNDPVGSFKKILEKLKLNDVELTLGKDRKLHFKDGFGFEVVTKDGTTVYTYNGKEYDSLEHALEGAQLDELARANKEATGITVNTDESGKPISVTYKVGDMAVTVEGLAETHYVATMSDGTVIHASDTQSLNAGINAYVAAQAATSPSADDQENIHFIFQTSAGVTTEYRMNASGEVELYGFSGDDLTAEMVSALQQQLSGLDNTVSGNISGITLTVNGVEVHLSPDATFTLVDDAGNDVSEAGDPNENGITKYKTGTDGVEVWFSGSNAYLVDKDGKLLSILPASTIKGQVTTDATSITITKKEGGSVQIDTPNGTITAQSLTSASADAGTIKISGTSIVLTDADGNTKESVSLTSVPSVQGSATSVTFTKKEGVGGTSIELEQGTWTLTNGTNISGDAGQISLTYNPATSSITLTNPTSGEELEINDPDLVKAILVTIDPNSPIELSVDGSNVTLTAKDGGALPANVSGSNVNGTVEGQISSLTYDTASGISTLGLVGGKTLVVSKGISAIISGTLATGKRVNVTYNKDGKVALSVTGDGSLTANSSNISAVSAEVGGLTVLYDPSKEVVLADKANGAALILNKKDAAKLGLNAGEQDVSATAKSLTVKYENGKIKFFDGENEVAEGQALTANNGVDLDGAVTATVDANGIQLVNEQGQPVAQLTSVPVSVTANTTVIANITVSGDKTQDEITNEIKSLYTPQDLVIDGGTVTLQYTVKPTVYNRGNITEDGKIPEGLEKPNLSWLDKGGGYRTWQYWGNGGEQDKLNAIQQLQNYLNAGGALTPQEMTQLLEFNSWYNQNTPFGSLSDTDSPADYYQNISDALLQTIELLTGGDFSLENIDTGHLTEVAEAFQKIAEATQTLAGFKWDVFADGLQKVLNVNNPAEGGPGADNLANLEFLQTLAAKLKIDLSEENEGYIVDLITGQNLERTINLKVNSDELAQLQNLFNFTAHVDTGGGAKDTNQGENNSSSSSSSSNATDGTSSIFSALIEAATKAQGELETAAAAVSEKVSNVASDIKKVGDAMGSVTNGRAGSRIQSVATAMSNIPTAPTINIKLKIQISEVNSAVASGTVKVTSSPSKPFSLTDRNYVSYAKGNRALAGGHATLMGELGPELVVSNGRYFVVGQGGAEMVDLAPDAVVFNHLQTQKLLSKGKSSRGRPITNERTAVAWSKGNINGGPAMDSASATLAALRTLRAQLSSLLKLSAQDLAGLGGTGGGGGGGGTQNNEPFLNMLERWYNWLQEIAWIEKEITYQETLRAKLSSDLVKDGQAYYDSEKETLALLQSQIDTQRDLNEDREKYFLKRREQLNTNGPFHSLYTFDEHGQIKYRDGQLEKLTKLSERDEFGAPKKTAEDQYNYIVNTLGINPKYLEYDSSGKKIDLSKDGGYASAVQAFWDRMQSDQDEMQDLWNGIKDGQKGLLDLEKQQNEILNAQRQNQLDLEQEVLKAITDSRQKQIDELKEQKDILKDSSDKYIDGLTDALDKERKLYDRQSSDNEITKLQRQLSILQRTGGSASAIANLQEQLTEKQRSAYFDKQQEQIDAVKDASEKQLEKMETQIDIMTKTLEYEKNNGLLWGQVYAILKKPEGEVLNFIMGNQQGWGEKSALAKSKDMEDLKAMIQQFFAKRNDTEWATFKQEASSGKYKKQWENSDIEKAAKAKFSEVLNNGGTIEEAKAAANQVFQEDINTGGWSTYSMTGGTAYKKYEKVWSADLVKKAQDAYATEYASSKDRSKAAAAADKIFEAEIDKGKAVLVLSITHGDGTTTIKTYKEEKAKTWTIADLAKANAKTGDDTNKLTVSQEKVTANPGERKSATATFEATKTLTKSRNYPIKMRKMTNKGPSDTDVKTANNDEEYNRYLNEGYKYIGFSKGGMVNYTGLAMLHGSKSNPEAVLNSEQTKVLRDEILSHKPDSFFSLMQQLRAEWQAQIKATGIIDNEQQLSNGSVIIEHAEVNLNAEIANDYDAKRAGQLVYNELLSLARKTGAGNTIRR